MSEDENPLETLRQSKIDLKTQEMEDTMFNIKFIGNQTGKKVSDRLLTVNN